VSFGGASVATSSGILLKNTTYKSLMNGRSDFAE
jgi:hypothetical protein